jgi:hypothetical protein
MNGADDVCKYQKWRHAKPHHRMITMGRPGSTKALLKGMKSAGMPQCGTADFLLGPELPDLSSSAARVASHVGDRSGLLQLLHPSVADWMLQFYGHPVGGGGAAAAAAAVEPPAVAAPQQQQLWVVRRADGAGSTLLRKVPSTSREDGVWVDPVTAVHDSEMVTVISHEPADNQGGVDFALVQTREGAVGYLNDSYLEVVHM